MTTIDAKAILLARLTDLDLELQMMVLMIRNEANVRKWMYTDHVIAESEHLDWIRRLRTDERQLVFAVLGSDRVPLGVVSVNAIDRLHRKADWAYYLAESARGGLGSALEYAIINYVFDSMGLDKLNCEVLEGNDAVVKMHTKFLFREEGFRRSNIIKNGVRIGVHFLGLTREDWVAGRVSIRERYSGVFDKFAIVISERSAESAAVSVEPAP